MLHEIIIAGFGGQGVMSMGQLLTYAGMLEGKHVSYIPSYGPEMRGGTANCTVVISDDEIGSPIVTEPNCVIVMNLPSLTKFEPALVPKGVLLVNSSMIKEEYLRRDIKGYQVAANELAGELGNDKVANMVMLGAFLKATAAVSPKAVIESLKKVLSKRRHNLIPLNKKALELGASIV
ncbi:MAG: 2-oxoacid:ferredoxin oxidoreductase subunit gamma [Desulfitibacter sp. BRH_c19]|nr:MAG: 2-oxoacid:ferredoxin oxidoreductase subunit gamma [Desulfitibacter sp. BRH_c19]